eukprot:gnl/MRDRNA2_/MRDRNA2_157785_c0_seq1.p1 gnl/MRDRNA2_/MRDRNA2_157785_c0~~gnl/MRDRNA2_/MRDRNA2_157785_c0_seq1.p1  ORF type:complete len:367 (+),score=65.44 gnl/MRDRNA2_/MRDRNA2_157785_c0_seq1:136-1236(+)
MHILVLHGYSGNAIHQERRDRQMQKLFRPLDVHFHYIDAPNQIPPFSEDLSERRFSWWSLRKPGSWERTVAYLAYICERDGPFDGILGFSQGAATAGQILAWKAAGSFVHDLKFAILVGGYLSKYPDLNELLLTLPSKEMKRYNIQSRWRKTEVVSQIPEVERHFDLPTLHLCGDRDRVTPPSMNLKMSALFKSPTVVHHSGGHYLPFDEVCMRAIVQFLKRFSKSGSTLSQSIEITPQMQLCQSCSMWQDPQGVGGEVDRQTGRWYCVSCWNAWHSRQDDFGSEMPQDFGGELDDLDADPDLQVALQLSLFEEVVSNQDLPVSTERCHDQQDIQKRRWMHGASKESKVTYYDDCGPTDSDLASID